MNKTLRVIAIAGLLMALGGCGRAGAALGDAMRNPGNYQTGVSGWYPSEIECPYEGWPLYWRERRPNANGQYICLYAGHGHSAVIACN